MLIALLMVAASCGRLGSDNPSACNGIARDMAKKPSITIPKKSTAPKSLEKRDVVLGTGASATKSDSVTVQYVGVTFSDGKEFDSSWDRGQPASFPLDGVITGWQDGIPGMKEHGRRCLVIPPEQAYGPPGRPPVIGPNETLVFVVDLVQVGGTSDAGANQ